VPLPRNTDSRQSPDLVPAGESQYPWEAVAEFKRLASLTADIADALSRSLRLRDGLHWCAEALVQGLDAAFARIWTLNEKENVLELQASAGQYTHLDGPHSRVPVGQLKIGLIAQERKPHLTNAVIGDPRVSDQEWAQREGMVAFAGYPLICDADRVVGVMALFARQPLTSATLRALATVANSIAHGITHWRAVEVLTASEQRFSLAICGTDEGIWDWNVLTNEAYYSARCKELLGYKEHEVENHYAAFESLLHPEDCDRVVRALQQSLQQRHPFQEEYRLLTRSGEYRWFQGRGQALWDDAGRPVRMLGSISDIHEHKLQEISRSIDLHQKRRTIRRYQDELAIARRIQQRMFPKDMPVLEGIEIAGAFQPASAAGGDYFDFISCPNGHLLLALGDVSGHGLGPALVVATARAYLQILALTDVTLDRICNLVNTRLAEDTDEEFMTLFLGLLDPSSRSLTYCNAGHCPAVILDARGEVRASLPSMDLPFGIELHHTYQKSAAVQLLPADLLLVVSDGVFEAFAPKGEAFGMARVLDTVRASRHLPPAEIIANLFGAVREFTQCELHDDMTVIVVKVAEAM
jgi:PAS domain S-box-containing protein